MVQDQILMAPDSFTVRYLEQNLYIVSTECDKENVLIVPAVVYFIYREEEDVLVFCSCGREEI